MNHWSGGTVIRIDRRTRSTMTVIICIIVTVFILIGILNFAGVIHNPNPPSTLVGIVVGAIVAGVAGIISLYRSRVVLHPQGIDVTRFLSGSRRLARGEIVARRLSPGGWHRAPFHVLIAQDGKEVKLPPYLEHSTDFQRWIEGIPLQ
jgi:hypothetical protein